VLCYQRWPASQHAIISCAFLGVSCGNQQHHICLDGCQKVLSYMHPLPRRSILAGRASAMAWEAAFVRLASGNLTAMCQAAGLRLSYSAERSVEDELSRESSTDASTVLLSYLAMLLCALLAICCVRQH